MKQPVTKKIFINTHRPCPPVGKWRAASPSAPFSITQSRAMRGTMLLIYYPVKATTYPDYRTPNRSTGEKFALQGDLFFHWIAAIWEYWAAMLMQRATARLSLSVFDVLLANPRVVLRCTCMTRLIVPVNPEPTTLQRTIRLVNSSLTYFLH